MCSRVLGTTHTNALEGFQALLDDPPSPPTSSAANMQSHHQALHLPQNAHQHGSPLTPKCTLSALLPPSAAPALTPLPPLPFPACHPCPHPLLLLPSSPCMSVHTKFSPGCKCPPSPLPLASPLNTCLTMLLLPAPPCPYLFTLVPASAATACPALPVPLFTLVPAGAATACPALPLPLHTCLRQRCYCLPRPALTSSHLSPPALLLPAPPCPYLFTFVPASAATACPAQLLPLHTCPRQRCYSLPRPYLFTLVPASLTALCSVVMALRMSPPDTALSVLIASSPSSTPSFPQISWMRWFMMSPRRGLNLRRG